MDTDNKPELYLCLDLWPKTPEDFDNMEDATMFKTVLEVLLHPAANGDGWARNWQVFDDREKALKYQKETDACMLVIPFARDTVPLELMP